MNQASLRPYIALWGLRSAWALAIALWALALLPWFAAPPSGGAATFVRSAVPAATVPAAPAAPAQSADADAGGAGVEPTAALPQRAARDDAVCGLDAAAGPSARANHLARQAGTGLRQAFEALRRRADVPSQAGAWWLRVLLAHDSEPAGCAAGADCDAPAAAATLPSLSVAIDALAQLAQVSNDARVQQLAQRACAGSSSATCASLGTRRWGTLEPDNAAAWLELAAHDAQAVDEALYRAGRASRFDAHRGQLAAQVLLVTPAQAPPMQRYAAWQRADELQRASDAATAAAAARACSDSARRDANRAQLCDADARWLAPMRTAPVPDATSTAALDCATIDRQWREARERAQRGAAAAPDHTPP
ncbi:MAG TPA: hypothetical protein VFZ28_12555 [Burkholderiaceae bacterium]|nr:hypothetical protein [Burkholderiaceae bacterium]